MSFLSELHASPMDPAIVDQTNPCASLSNLHAVEYGTSDAATHTTRVFHPDFVARDRFPSAAVAEYDFVAWPRLGQTWIDGQCVAVDTESENGFDSGTVQPTRRTGIPSPAAAAYMRRYRVDVSACDVWLNPIALARIRRAALVDRIENSKQIARVIPLTQGGECEY